MPSVSPKRAFLKAFVSSGGNLTKAAESVGIDRTMHYRWLKDKDGKYAAAFREASEQAAQLLEDEGIRRAKDGWMEPVFYKGQLVTGADGKTPMGIKRYSDSLMMFLLRGMRPEKYRERHVVEGAGKDGAIIVKRIIGVADEEV